MTTTWMRLTDVGCQTRLRCLDVTEAIGVNDRDVPGHGVVLDADFVRA